MSTVNMNEVAGILKYYLRSLPEPLIPSEILAALIGLLDLPNIDGKITMLRQLWKHLPADNRRVLEYLFNFFLFLCSNKNSTLDELKIAIIFAPNLLFPEQTTIEYTLQIPQIVQAVKLLLENFSKVIEV